MTEAHVVALSGGKDSTAMALRLAEVEPRDYVYICTPTGDELPEMFAHWRKLGELLGSRVVPIVADTLNGLIDKQNALPNWRMRWCTRILKIEPFEKYLIGVAESHDKVVSYVGLRADEAAREGGDYNDVPGIEMRYPLREWSWGLSAVWSYLVERGVEIPKRTDCARCFWQRIEEWYALWRDHLDAYMDAEAQEIRLGHTFRSPRRDTQPTALKDLRAKFEDGYVPKEAQPTLFEGLKCRVCRI